MSVFLKQHTNTLVSILTLLGVKHTNKYAETYYNEHPYKYSLFGLSKILNHYKVYNKGIKVEKKEDIYLLETPFIAHIGNDFVVVKNTSNEGVCYYWRQRKLTIPIKDFLEIWSGVALVVEADTTSTEPDYRQHRKEELGIWIPNTLLILAGIVLVALGLLQNQFLHKGRHFT